MSNSVRRDWLFLVLNSQASITRVDPSRWNGQRDRTKTCRPFAGPLSWPRRNWKSSIEPSSRYARAATERNSLASSSTWLSRRWEEERQQRKVKWVEGIGIKMSVLPFPTALSWWWYRSLFWRVSHTTLSIIRSELSGVVKQLGPIDINLPFLSGLSLFPTSRSVPNSAVRLPIANSVMVAY